MARSLWMRPFGRVLIRWEGGALFVAGAAGREEALHEGDLGDGHGRQLRQLVGGDHVGEAAALFDRPFRRARAPG